MEVVMSGKGFVDVLLPKQGISDISKAGFNKIAIDLDMYCSGDNLKKIEKRFISDTCNDKSDEEIFDLKEVSGRLFEKCVENQLDTSLVMAPSLPFCTTNLYLNEILLQLAKQSIELCGAIGCKDIVIKPLFVTVSRRELWKVNKKFYMELASVAEKYDVRILLPNLCKNIGGHLVRGVCSELEEAVYWIDKLNEMVSEERFGFCVDVGVCNICGINMYDFIVGLGDRVKAVIIRECDGIHDESMLPFTSVNLGQSNVDWLNLIRGLRKISYDNKLVFDISSMGSAFSIVLRPHLLIMAMAVSEYFKWQIEMEKKLNSCSSIVLFGAGNMCRNYMKCYGDDYPPLFTCDNNPAMWDTQFCGIQVKNPNVLRDLPNDCVILICNIYYSEIKKQLRDMNINNPIEYFSDEYMPSFHYHRL